MNTPLHFQKFNDKVRAMNQSHGKELRLTANEARALHTDLFALLDELAGLRELDQPPNQDAIYIEVDAGDNSL